MNRLTRCGAIALFLALSGCRSKVGVQSAAEIADSLAKVGISASAKPVRIASPAGPVAWLGCEVVGAPCEAVGLLPPGASAHTWEPKPSDLARIDGVDAWLRTGLAFEATWTDRIQGAFPNLPVLDLRGALDLEDQDDDHGKSHHGSEPMDPHVWASPRAMKVLAETLAVRLSLQRPDLAERISRRMPRVRMHLDSLDAFARALLAPWSGRVFLINHPGLGYLARDYGLVQRSLEHEGRELSPVDMFELRRVSKSQGVRAIYVVREASQRVARSVGADLEVPVVEIDLLAQPWDSAFRACVSSLAEGL